MMDFATFKIQEQKISPISALAITLEQIDTETLISFVKDTKRGHKITSLLATPQWKSSRHFAQEKIQELIVVY